MIVTAEKDRHLTAFIGQFLQLGCEKIYYIKPLLSFKGMSKDLYFNCFLSLVGMYDCMKSSLASRVGEYVCVPVCVVGKLVE